MKKSIAFNLKPTGNEIAKVGEKGKRFLKSHGLSDDSVQKQIMVVRELIKSGITFESQKHALNEMSVHIFIEENIRLRNSKIPVIRPGLHIFKGGDCTGRNQHIKTQVGMTGHAF